MHNTTSLIPHDSFLWSCLRNLLRDFTGFQLCSEATFIGVGRGRAPCLSRFQSSLRSFGCSVDGIGVRSGLYSGSRRRASKGMSLCRRAGLGTSRTHDEVLISSQVLIFERLNSHNGLGLLTLVYNVYILHIMDYS